MKLTRGERTVTCLRATYEGLSGRVVCRGDPVLRDGESIIRCDELIYERHRHRYEVNNAYRDRLTEAGLVISGLSPDGKLVEMCELPEHPWFLGMQGHPEFKSRPTRPAPLFRDFIGAAVAFKDSRRG